MSTEGHSRGTSLLRAGLHIIEETTMANPPSKVMLYLNEERHGDGLGFEYTQRELKNNLDGTVSYVSAHHDTKWLSHGGVSLTAVFGVEAGKPLDNGWEGLLRSAKDPYSGEVLDSDDGWLRTKGSSSERWRFIERGDGTYEMWQASTNRPVLKTDSKPDGSAEDGNGRMRCMTGGTPAAILVRVV
jgi:hypothetical protein